MKSERDNKVFGKIEEVYSREWYIGKKKDLENTKLVNKFIGRIKAKVK